jgi:hypothetical protein
VIEATNSPFGFGDAVLGSRIGGWVVLAGISDGYDYTLSGLRGTQARPQDQICAPNGRRLSARHRPRIDWPCERESYGDAPREHGRAPAVFEAPLLYTNGHGLAD